MDTTPSNTLEGKDPYYFLPECSNSDLSWLKSFFEPEDLKYDKEKAYKAGTLLDCMITEIFKVNFFKFTCCGNQHTRDEFKNTEKMKASFWRHPYCKLLAENSDMQKIMRCPKFRITYQGVTFSLPFRIKWDLYAWETIGQGGDIKSTTAETYKQFLAACHHFEYFRQRAVYMDVAQQVLIDMGLGHIRVDTDMLIGVSKVNHQVFTVPIVRGGELYEIGKEQYSRLGFQYASLFGNIQTAA